LGVGKTFVRKFRKKFDDSGAASVVAPQSKSNRKIDNEELRNAVFSLLHEPPSNHGINRTSWTMPLICQALSKNGRKIGRALVSKMIKGAGYKWRKAKLVLTSNDPTYTEKLDRIRSILSSLETDEAFFSIDEYGPFCHQDKTWAHAGPTGSPTDGPPVAEVARLYDHYGRARTVWQSGCAFL
jgi:transposase